MKLKPETPLNATLTILAIAAIFGMFSGSPEPVIGFLRGSSAEHVLLELHHRNSIVFNLSVGYLVSMLFWLLVVYIPERKERNLIRDNLSRRYRHFREDTIEILLRATAGACDFTLPKILCDHHKFREFFDENNKAHWYAALNGLQENKEWIDDLLLEMELFSAEIGYVLSKVNIYDPKVHAFFKRLREHIYRLKNASVYSCDSVKYLGGFLWEIHARWSMIDGQRENDIIDDMIASI